VDLSATKKKSFLLSPLTSIQNVAAFRQHTVVDVYQTVLSRTLVGF